MQLSSYYNNNPNSIYNPSDNKTPSYNIDTITFKVTINNSSYDIIGFLVYCLSL